MQVGQKVGPFIIDKVLGSGAMGTVYRARYLEKKLRVAIKEIGAGMLSNPNIRARFIRESKILKQLKHPNIVAFYGSGTAEGAPWYAMEYIEGESLDYILARRSQPNEEGVRPEGGRFSWEDVVAIGQQLCDALQHAHQKGIIHRDLKPSNLMMLPDGTIKLTDFGIAKDTEAEGLTATHSTVGTASYMSPEQCKGDRDLSLKSDLYSMGIVFFELLTGRKPFTAETPMDMFLKHLKEEPECRPAQLVPDCPIWLDTLIMQLLEKDPQRRPRDAALVGEALGQISEKVQAQQSAGVDAARARRVDRSRHAPQTDEADKEAARALRGGKGKKRTKKKAVIPIYRKPWFIIAGLVLVFVMFSSAVYLAVQASMGVPVTGASPVETLYAQAKPLMESDKPEDWAKARNHSDGPLDQFEHLHSTATGKQAEQMHAWIEQVDIAEKQIKLDRLVRSALGKLSFKIEPLEGAETFATHGAVAEAKGNLDEAAAAWKELLQKVKAEGADRPWYLMAQKRVWAFEHLDSELKRMADVARDPERIDVLGNDKAKTESEKAAVEALTLEMNGKTEAARDAWNKLKEKVENDLSQRLWYYAAIKKDKELKAK